MPTAEAFLGVLPFNLKSTASPIPRRLKPGQGGNSSSINDRFSRLFKNRGSRISTTDASQHRTRTDRQGVSEVETHYLQKRSTELLLENDLLMTRFLCRLEISGDKAAALASHLVSFIRGNPQTADSVEAFVTEAYDEYLDKYARVSLNPRNILRDNNLANMLVVCYLQQSCRDYLVSILQPVMKAIGPYVENCELDPSRLPPDSKAGDAHRNSYNLYCVCRTVLDAVFSAGKHAPPSMRRLCAFIRRRIEEELGIAPRAPLKDRKQKQQAPQLPILEMREWENDLKSTVQADIMSDIKAALDGWLGRPEDVKLHLPSGSDSKASAGSSSSRKTQQQTAAETAAEKPGARAVLSTNKKQAPESRADAGTAASSCDPETRKKIEDMMSSSFASIDKLDTSFLFEDSGLPGRSSSKLNPKVSTQASQMSQSPRWSAQSPVASRHHNKHSSKRQSSSYFSPVETVISMLIFVRFFIPILTAPDTYGLDVNMSPANRRGLLLCAKVLAVLCNGVSFGSKEPYLLPMNGLIRDYRPKLRRYLNSVSSNVGHSEDPSNDGDEASSGDECSDEDSVTIDELASQFKIASVGAKIATKEEQRKSRQSLSRMVHLNAANFSLRYMKSEMPPVPPISPAVLLASQPAAPATSERADIVSRATIDIPIHRSSSAQSQDSQTSSNGVDDSSLVTLDFLLCLESNLAKIEGMAQEYAGSDSSSGKHVQTALREFRPIILYAKHLAAPSRLSGPAATIAIASQPSQSQARRPVLPLMSSEPKPGDPAGTEAKTRQRVPTLPDTYRFVNAMPRSMI